MIIKLTPEQVSVYWDMIRHGVVVTYRPSKLEEANITNKLLENLLIGKAQCWMGFNIVEGKREFSAFCVTLLEETSVGQIQLLIHTLYGFRFITPELLSEAMPMMEKFALTSGCSRIIMYTNNSRLQEYCADNNFNQDTKLYTRELI